MGNRLTVTCYWPHSSQARAPRNSLPAAAAAGFWLMLPAGFAALSAVINHALSSRTTKSHARAQVESVNQCAQCAQCAPDSSTRSRSQSFLTKRSSLQWANRSQDCGTVCQTKRKLKVHFLNSISLYSLESHRNF